MWSGVKARLEGKEEKYNGVHPVRSNGEDMQGSRTSNGVKLGILGGTFNPVHIGHLVAGQEVIEKMALNKIIFIPSAHPPHKSEEDLAPARHRLRMLKLAVQKKPFFHVNTLEIERRGKSYSVETMKALRRAYGKKAEFFFILGTDAVAEIFTWKDVNKFLKMCKLIVVERPGFSFKGVKKELPCIHSVSMTHIGISSSQIRQRLHEGKPISHLVPEKVEEYIKKYRLYE